MAMDGKLAGILSGLAVGVTGGVILAAMNPILPRNDETAAVASAPAIAPVPEVAEVQPAPLPSTPHGWNGAS